MEFGEQYASIYDAIYETKNYERETREIEALMRHSGLRTGPSPWMLDLGCGTGSHAYEFAKLGYEVVGVDRSLAMLRMASLRTSSQQPTYPNPIYLAADIGRMCLARRFEAVVMLFAVFGYQVEDEQVVAALRTASSHLQEGGLLAFDFWYAPAVTAIGFSDPTRSFVKSGDQLARSVATRRTAQEHVFDIEIEIRPVEGSSSIHKVTETHRMRAFDEHEVNAFLGVADLELVDLCSFPDLGATPLPESWSALAIARSQ